MNLSPLFLYSFLALSYLAVGSLAYALLELVRSRRRGHVFVAYAQSNVRLAAKLAMDLRAEGHEVFFDKEKLPAADTFNDRIRKFLSRADILVFLASPDSVASGAYAVSEAKIFEGHHTNPKGRALCIRLDRCSVEDIPIYLRSVSFLEPAGSVVAEGVAEVDRLIRGLRQVHARRSGAALVLSAVLGVGRITLPRPQIVRQYENIMPLVIAANEKAVVSQTDEVDFLEVSDLVRVESGAELLLQPGVALRFYENVGIRVDGTVRAMGTSVEPVVFTAFNEARGWGHVALRHGSGSLFSRCRFSYGRGMEHVRHELDSGQKELDHLAGTKIRGGALFAYRQTDLRLEYCEFESNASMLGGAVYVAHSTPVEIRDCVFRRNVAASDSELSGGGAVFAKDVDLEISGSSFQDNSVTGRYGSGGALYLREGRRHLLMNVRFSGNKATYLGGAVYALFRFSSDDTRERMLLEFRECRFLDNSSGTGGGGAYVDGGVDSRFWDCNFDANSSSEVDEGGYGGGASICSVVDDPNAHSEVKVRDGVIPERSVRVGARTRFLGDGKLLQD